MIESADSQIRLLEPENIASEETWIGNRMLMIAIFPDDVFFVDPIFCHDDTAFLRKIFHLQANSVVVGDTPSANPLDIVA